MSAEPRPLRVVLCWHMHQPDYRGPDGGDFKLPWVYLHGIKDYVDMAHHLETVVGARAVVNFTPTLLEQLDDYAGQIAVWLDSGERIHDPLLAALAGPLPTDAAARLEIITACRRANEAHLINAFPPFRRLLDLADCLEPADQSAYLGDQFLVDLLMWYHIAWMGESVQQCDERLATLRDKSSHYDAEDRRRMLELIGELIAGIVPRYRALAEADKVELSVTPYAHPILPLLLDLKSAREAMPTVQLPEYTEYPGGEERAKWHIRQGLEVFRQHFGHVPPGCWPAEGGVSDAACRLLAESGSKWLATGQQVLHNSLEAGRGKASLSGHWPHRPYRLDGDGGAICFFRDDGLSDLIGFTYSTWHAEDAVANLVEHLENIARESKGAEDAVVSIIMDGENAWEYYPHNGSYFLQGLYQRLADHPGIELTTYQDCLHDLPEKIECLPSIVAGSWVYGTFSTWIGDKDKNRAWDMLIEAKRAVDQVLASGRLSAKQQDQVLIQLAHCEGSDWFWWFGDYNPAGTVSDFEQLYRQQLAYLYGLIGVEAPAYLGEVLSHGSGEPARGGVMRQTS